MTPSSTQFILLLLFGGVAHAAFPPEARQVIERHCIACHGTEKQKGGVDFSMITDTDSAMANHDLWRKVIDQVESLEMPPEDETQLTEQERQQLTSWVAAAFDTSKNPDPGPPLVRQLTRTEYYNTMRDLLSVNFDAAAAGGIPSEQVVTGFTNQAGVQILDQALLQKYFSAADETLTHLFTHKNEEGARKKLIVAEPSADLSPQEAIRQTLAVFLRRAFRRPVEADEVERFADLAYAAIAEGDDFNTALRKAMKPALVSPHFLLRLESPPTDQKVSRVSDHELAVRLSYFLWSTMPDEELSRLADEGKLADPEILRSQARRMLGDRRAEAVTHYFLSEWLQLPHLGRSLPDQKFFPTYTRSLRDAMGREAQMFCNHMREEDRSILEFLNSDYTFVNDELAKHYRIKGVGKEWQKVSLKPENHRGGLLGMAGILTMTSHTDRTKPTARGTWILEVILGTPPPPPPADAGNFAPPSKDRPPPRNFREQLAQHAADPNCVTCHKRIDPLGFALENYDAIGVWRDDIGGEPVDNAGRLPGIGDFNGIDGLRKVIDSKQEQFVRHLVATTLEYALGRPVSYYDEPSINRIVADLQANDHRFSTLILGVIESFPFLHRRDS